MTGYMYSHSHCLQRAMNVEEVYGSASWSSPCKFATLAETGIGSLHQMQDTPRLLLTSSFELHSENSLRGRRAYHYAGAKIYQALTVLEAKAVL